MDKGKGVCIIWINDDWNGEYTFVGARGNTVIDYAIVNEEALDRIVELKIDSRADPDHMKITWKKEEERRQEVETEEEEEKEEEEEEEEKSIIVWDEEAIKKFKEETEESKIEVEVQNEGIEEKWEKLKGRI